MSKSFDEYEIGENALFTEVFEDLTFVSDETLELLIRKTNQDWWSYKNEYESRRK